MNNYIVARLLATSGEFGMGLDNTFLLSLLSGSLTIGLISLAVIYRQFRQTAQATAAKYQDELQTLTAQSQRTQTQLEEKLRQTGETLQTTLREKGELETQVEALKQQCSRLRDDLGQQAQQVQRDTQTIAFEQLQTLLTQHPTVRRMAAVKPDLPAKNLVALFTSLDNLVQFWGYEAIGEPWQETTYDPQLHQGDVPDLQVGERVYVRFVGYREAQSQQIRVPAKVSRTLPAGATGGNG
jgi:Skp family chaperone for outer membrane proteins